jgi:hypothetical protein
MVSRLDWASSGWSLALGFFGDSNRSSGSINPGSEFVGLSES